MPSAATMARRSRAIGHSTALGCILEPAPLLPPLVAFATSANQAPEPGCLSGSRQIEAICLDYASVAHTSFFLELSVQPGHQAPAPTAALPRRTVALRVGFAHWSRNPTLRKQLTCFWRGCQPPSSRPYLPGARPCLSHGGFR